MPGIFINYRREDSGGYTQQIYRALSAHFGAHLVFMDIDTIRSGEDYRAIIRDAIAQSDVFLAVIGRTWLNCTDADGNHRLLSPMDLVRKEVAQALDAKILVIPVLVGHAPMPRADALPDDLKPLAGRNAHDIPDKFFDQSVRQLIQTIAPYVHGKRPVSRRTILYGAGGAMGVLLAAAIADGLFKTHVPVPEGARTGNMSDDDLKYAGMQAAVEAVRKQPAVVVRNPGNVAVLPAEVAGPWKIDRGNFAGVVTGPQREPKVVWISNVSVGDAWKPICFAPDRTLFLFDEERHAVFAVKDGAEQWAASAGDPMGFTAGGLIVLREELLSAFGSTFLCFNSRGAGGTCRRPLKAPPSLIREVDDTYGELDGRCQGGAVTLARSKVNVQLDGNCTLWGLAHDDRGRLYVSTDRGTLYCLGADGKVLWSYKAEEEMRDRPVFSMGDAVFAVKDTLICVRDGVERWKLKLDGCQPHLVDKAGTIYVTHQLVREARMSLDKVSAVDRNGKLLWSMPMLGAPTMLDPEGRLYVMDASKGFVACLA